MSHISTREYIDVREQARHHGMGEVSNLAMLPRGFETSHEPLIDQEATTLRKLLGKENVELQVLGESARVRTSILKSADWTAPVLFIGAGLLSQNPLAVDVAVSVIGSYATDFLKHFSSSPTIKLSIAVESTKGKTTKLVTYEGSVDGLSEISDVLKRVAGD